LTWRLCLRGKRGRIRPAERIRLIPDINWTETGQKWGKGKGKRLLEFIHWVTREGQEYNTDLFYARLPPGLAERAEQRLKEVRIAD